MDCPFCDLPNADLVFESELLVGIRDRYPVSRGHTLLIPRRHIPTWFDASPFEQMAMVQAIAEVKATLDAELGPDGYNVGFNSGAAAGQTVMHLHLHVIPRYDGDVPDPRGGVRGVIPAKQNYLAAAPTPPVQGSLFGNAPVTEPVDASDPFTGLPGFVPGESTHLLPSLRRAMRDADEIDVLSAFVQMSGVELIEGPLVDALTRGARVRLLTGNYLHVTHPHALSRLFTLTTEFPALQARLYQTSGAQSFHPKAFVFVRGPHGVAFVGSSNLSQSALTDGVEWNLKTTGRDPGRFAEIRARFERLFEAPQSAPLTRELVAEYASQVRVPPRPEPADAPPVPHGIQREVLGHLTEARAEGASKGLVVMATGLGKTFLSAFDFDRVGGKRALFVAHRQEILHQAAATWAKVHPEKTIGFLHGGQRQPDADVLFASVQTLSRVRHLREFDPGHFDYVVIDEFHHAAASSYRKLLAHFEPSFLLGLTATPDRLDGAALLDLCDGNLVSRIGLVEGIARELLVPFHYYGVHDETDFAPIPWRSGRFDTQALTESQTTQDRAAQALREYQAHAPDLRRSLVFCCSKRHADYIAAYFSEHGVPAVAVHSGPESAPRTESLERLQRGEIEAIVAVDIFNEGVDLPDVNTILMLRPTASPIIFLQQLGRGLRRPETIEKPHLTVIDFIGNHRAFLVKPQALLALTGKQVAPGEALHRLRDDNLDLPEGCSVDIDTDVIDMLERVARISKDDALIYTYQQLRDNLGRRPTATELFDAGSLSKPIRDRYGTWFHFLDHLGDLTEAERDVLHAQEDWFRDLTQTRMVRSYKMVALQMLDDLDALHDDVDVVTLSTRCRDKMLADPLLHAELTEHQDAGGEVDDFVKRWREMPLRVFHNAKGMTKRWFTLDGDRFQSELRVAEHRRGTFDEMTAELVAHRLREFLVKKRRFVAQVLPFTAPVEMKVSHSNQNPILRFDRKKAPHLPTGETQVWVDGEQVWLPFLGAAVNVAVERAGGPNILPTLMRGWFGPTAGLPGTDHRVELVPQRGGKWTLRKRDVGEFGQVIALGQVPYYPELSVACGVATAQFEGHDVAEHLCIDTERSLSEDRHFVVRVEGDSMDGGVMPLKDGDLVLCEWATVTDPAQVEGKPVLLTGGTGDEVLATIKIPIRREGRWWLRSANPSHADQPLDPSVAMRVVGRPVEVVEERRGPALWGLYDRNQIAGLFGHENNPSWRCGHRDVTVNGEPHSVLMVNLKKPKGTPLEHQYADAFLSPSEFQWESQSTTTPDGAKGKRILHHVEEGRLIHLFVRYHTKTQDGKGEPFVYCGTVTTQRFEGSRPVRVWFELGEGLPELLWRVWAG